MIRIQLSPEELAYLEQTRRARRSQVAERCHYVLLNAAGYSVPQIAQRLERHEHTIRKWLCAYRAQGVMGLQNGLSVSDATVRRRLKAGGWVYKRLSKTLPHKAPSAEQKKSGWHKSLTPSKS